MTDDQLLSVRGLSKTITLHILGGKQVQPLRDVSFDAGRGELLAAVGLSGAGKSSLLKCIYRTYLAGGGSINYRTESGEVIDLATAEERSVLALRRREIGYVSQFLKAPPRVPAVDMVARPLVMTGVAADEARRRAVALLERLGIGSDLQLSYPSLFSGGEQQRINVARALVVPPRLLLLDEPTSALDVANQERVLELLAEARAAGTTMVGVFHDLNLLRRIADRVLVLDGGRVQACGPAHAVDLNAWSESGVAHVA